MLNPRSVFAIWSLVDDEKVEIYSRVRLISFYIQWIVLFILIVGFAFFTVFQNDENSNQFFLLLSLAELAALLIIALLDYHWCKVIVFYASGAPKRRKRRQKEERKAWRAAEREKRMKERFPPQIADGMAEDGIENPIVVPSQNLIVDIPSDNVGVEDVETRSKGATSVTKAKKHNNGNHAPIGTDEEDRRQPSQRKKKHKSKKRRKTDNSYDDEY